MFPWFEDLRNIVSSSPGSYVAILLALWAGIKMAKEKFDSAKELFAMVMVVPGFFLHRVKLREEVKTLRRRQDRLNCRKDDYNTKLETQVRRPRKEVEVWMKQVDELDGAVQKLQRNVMKWTYWFGSSRETAIRNTLKEVDELLNAEFPDDLTLDVHENKPYPTPALIDRDTDLQQITDWLNDPNVSRIGVYGVKGVGKTAVLREIQKRLSQITKTSSFGHVYWVSVGQSNVNKLQNSIAREVGFDLSVEEDQWKRKAKLQAALIRRGKSVIILDDVVKLHMIDDIGIAESGCKLVMSTESQRNCKRLLCEGTLEMKPLSEKGSMELFRRSLRNCIEPEFEEIMGKIVEECKGLPRSLVNMGERLKGVDDLNEWNCVWREFREGGSS